MRSIQFTLFGCEVNISASFFLLVAWLMCIAYELNLPLWIMMVYAVVLFVSVLVHEFGHALAFRWYGARDCVSVHVHALGGHTMACEWCTQSLTSWQRCVVVFAGPAAGLGLTGGAIGLVLCASTEPMYGLATQLVLFNLVLSVTNLIPLFPLDGGHLMEEMTGWVLGRGVLWHIVTTFVNFALTFALLLAMCAFADWHKVRDWLGVVQALLVLGANIQHTFARS